MPAESRFPVMGDMTVRGIREYLREKKSVIVPIGVIEQHGYHLPLKTDALIAGHLGRMIGERTQILVAPTIYQSFSGGCLGCGAKSCMGSICSSPFRLSKSRAACSGVRFDSCPDWPWSLGGSCCC